MPLVLGLNHHTASLDLRERLSISPEKLPSFLTDLKASSSLDEIVALSTCNRTEFYAHSPDPAAARASLSREVTRLAGVSFDESSLYCHVENDCVRHLFRVASGLDSMVRGEHEILGQVKQAYTAAQAGGFTGKWLNVLFQRSLFVGKRVRSQTGVSQGAGSVGSVAVSITERIFGDFEGRTVMILGAGAVAEETARCLQARRVRSIIVANRTFDRACILAKEFGGTAMHFEEGLHQLAHCDIVISSTGAPHVVLTRDRVEAVIEERRGRPLFLIDLAVPRDVEPGVQGIDNVYLFNLDDLQRIVSEDQARRRVEIERAETLVEVESQNFVRWLAAQKAGLLSGLKHQAP